jgi:hypothetical protein
MSVAEIATDDLTSETELNKSEFIVRLMGSAETAAMGKLDAYLKILHEEATKSGVGAVVIDMRKLEFMNSSCFKTFVSWIGVIQDSPADRQYKVRFVASEQKHWQSRSLGALACFAVDLISVESA